MGTLQAQSPMLLAFFLINCVSSCGILGVDRRRSRSFEGTPSPLELYGIFGDGVNQAADFFSDATSIPSRNVTPLTTFGN